jgi:hypothetical protein
MGDHTALTKRVFNVDKAAILGAVFFATALDCGTHDGQESPSRVSLLVLPEHVIEWEGATDVTPHYKEILSASNLLIPWKRLTVHRAVAVP